MSLVAAVVPAKLLKMVSVFFERGENLLQNGIFHFVFKYSSKIVLQS